MALQSQSREENGSDSSLIPQRVLRQKDRYFSGQCNPWGSLYSNLHTFPISFGKILLHKCFTYVFIYIKIPLIPIKMLVYQLQRKPVFITSHSRHSQSSGFESEVHLVNMFPMWATKANPTIPTRLTPWTDVLPLLPVGTFPLWLLWSQDWSSVHTRAVVSF